VRSADGTALRAWCNDGAGPPVLLCNGLGAPEAAWPGLVARSSGYRVISWSYRGLAGSARPVDPARVRVEDHTDDARAVLDAFDVPAATVVGWSLGVNVAFELALEDPQRVLGVLAVAGVPGGSFSSLFAPYGVPRRLRAPMGRWGSALLLAIGPMLPPIVASLPPWPELLSPGALRGPASEMAHPAALRAVLQEFSRHDWRWFRRARAAGHHAGALPGHLRGGPPRLAGRRRRRPQGRGQPAGRAAARAAGHPLPAAAVPRGAAPGAAAARSSLLMRQAGRRSRT
jgi:3-oxoadipate enol-lactonase